MSVSLLELKTYFRKASPTRTELMQMSVINKNTTQCAMHLQDSAWFVPLWNALADAEKMQFRRFIGTELLKLTVPAYFAVDVCDGSTNVVLFYVYNDLQALVDERGSPFFSGTEQQRMQDAISALHNPHGFAYSHFVEKAYCPPPAASVPGISVAAQLARLHAFSI